MAADEYNHSITVQQGTSQKIFLKNSTSDLVSNCSITILKPGMTAFGTVVNTSPTNKITLTSGYYYVWDANETDLDTIGVNVVKLYVPASSTASYTYVNVIEPPPTTPDIAPRPAL